MIEKVKKFFQYMRLNELSKLEVSILIILVIDLLLFTCNTLLARN